MQLSMSDLRELIGSESCATDCPFEVGKAYIIRSVTHYSVGRVKAICGHFLVLSDASWVQDTGRWHDALRTGDLNEIEPFTSDAIIGLGGIIDATEWEHNLPSEQK